MSDLPFDQIVRELRVRIKTLRAEVRALTKPSRYCKPGADPYEVESNLILAYRHLEDAGMRLGKAIQAYDGGVSVYDKEAA
jgi:hypothetical protein